MKMVKKKKEIKIIREANHIYTFLDSSSMDNKQNKGHDNNTITISKPKEQVFNIRSLNSKKSKIRHRSRIIGGQNKQGHTSVYE